MALTVAKLGKKLKDIVYDGGKPLVNGTISFVSSRDQLSGLNAEEIHSFPPSTVREHYHLDKDEEGLLDFEKNGLRYVIDSMRSAVSPAILEEISLDKYRANVRVRRASSSNAALNSRVL